MQLSNSGALALRTERQSARMSEIKNGGLDQYGAEPFEQQRFGTAGVKWVNTGMQLLRANDIATHSGIHRPR